MGHYYAGSSATFQVTIQPSQLGLLTNTVTVVAANTVAASSNTATIAISAQVAPVSLLNFSPSLITFDETRNRLFFADQAGIWSIDPETSVMNGPSAFPDQSFGGIAALESSQGALYAFRALQFSRGQFVRIDPDTLAISNWFTGGFTLYDFKISPVDTNVVFISDERASAIAKDSVGLPNYLTYKTHGQFSPDGTKFYVVNPENCELQIFSVSNAGLILAGTQTTGSCSDFKQAGGLLYYDTGMIYDPLAGHKSTNSLTLPTGSSVVPRDDATLDMVTKRNGVWLALRLASDTHQELRRVYLDNVPGLPGRVIAAGDNRIALLTAVGGIYLIDFSPDFLDGQISLLDQTATVTFSTNPGHTYRLERTDHLAGTWSAIGADFAADTSTHELKVSVGQSGSAFFRLIQMQ